MPKRMIPFGMAILLFLLGYGFLYEPASLRLTRVTIDNAALARVLAGKTVLQISDLHLGGAQTPVQKLLAFIKELQPDLILLTGDYVQWFGDRQTYEATVDLLGRLEAPLGIYAVLGDADYGNSRYSCLFCHDSETNPARQAGHRVQFLKNSREIVETTTGRLVIWGITEEPDAQDEEARILPSLDPELPALVLAHTSETYARFPPTADILFLAGDTHGGQLYLPRPLWPLLRMLPDPTHLHGLFSEGRKNLYVSSGVGSSHLPFRLGRPPELVVFRFTP